MSDRTGPIGPSWAGAPPPPPGAPPAPPARPWHWYVLGGVALATAVIGAALLLTTGDDAAEGDGADRTVVQLEGIEHVSAEPFTDSVVNAGIVSGPPAGDPVVTAGAAPGTAGTLRVASTGGSQAGLYGSTTAGEACDRPALALHLGADTDVRTTWAGLAGVAPDEVASTVMGLTPLVLRHDTAVTNHTYQAGGGHRYQAVLQAGTAVLVDDQGLPRVQCSCGNPLLAPDLLEGPVDLDGDAWDGFTREDVIAVEPEPVDEFATIDIDTGDEDTVAVGYAPDADADAVELDGYLLSDEDGVWVTDGRGDRTLVLDEAVHAAFDDGAGGLIYQPGRDGSDAPWRLASQPPDRRAAATIWHLPAGEAEPVALVDRDEPTRAWAVPLTTGRLGSTRYLAYADMTHDPSLGEVDETRGDLVLLDLDTGATEVLVAGAYGWETWYEPVSITATRLAVQHGYAGPAWSLYDADLQVVANGCENPLDDLEVRDCPFQAALTDAWGLVGMWWSETGESFALTATDPATGQVDRTYDRPPTGMEPDELATWMGRIEVEAWGDRAVLWWQPADGHTPLPATAIDLADGTTSDLDDLTGRTWILRTPLVRPAGSVDDGAPSTPSEAMPDDDAPGPQPEEGAEATEVAEIVALTADDQVAAGFDVTPSDHVVSCDYATPSHAAVGRDVVWCGSTADSADVCWIRADRVTLLCGTSPWEAELRELRSSRPLETIDPDPDPLPWGLELEDGTRCRIRVGGAWGGRADGWNGAYWCEGLEEVVVLASPDGQVVDRSGPAWTVHLGPLGGPEEVFPPPDRVRVAVAWFAGSAG